MATYEDIKKANEAIRPIDIGRGKDYVEVNQRVTAFRMVYPTGTIDTQIISLEGGVCVMKATCADENGTVLGTGHAYEKEGSTFINKTSYIENCETSAVGRALGMAGFGIDVSICSAEELSNAILNQGDKKKNDDIDPESSIEDTPDAVKKLKGMIGTLEKMGATAFMGELEQMYGIKRIEDIKKGDYRTIVQLAQNKYDLLKEAK